MSHLPATFVEGFHDEESVLKMKYNSLGSTGLQVSELSLGGGVFSFFYEKFDEQEAINTIRTAIQRGINYIDTAPWYGQGQSEITLGKALLGIPREAYYIGTKVGRYELDYKLMFDFSKEKTISSVDTSLERLGLQHIDIIQVHDIEFAPSLEIVLNETLPTLSKIRDEGKAKYIGVTGYPLSILKEAICSAPFPLDTVLTYARNTLIDNSLNDYISFFQEKKIGVICAADHCMGLLTSIGAQKWHKAPKDVKDRCVEAAMYCTKQEVELGKLALWYSTELKGVSTHLVGMNRMKILESNMSVFFDGLTGLEKEILKKVQEKYFKSLNTSWEGVEVENYWNHINNK